MKNKATAWSGVSIRQFTCLVCKEKNLSPKSLLRLHLLQSLRMKQMTAQVQTHVFDHDSKQGYVWSAEVVTCQQLAHGTINQAVLMPVQSQTTSFESILEFQKQDVAYLKKKKKKKAFGSVPLGSFSTLFIAHVLCISSISHLDESFRQLFEQWTHFVPRVSFEHILIVDKELDTEMTCRVPSLAEFPPLLALTSPQLLTPGPLLGCNAP